MQIFNIVIAGVGGQGVLMASKVLAESALASGMDVKQNEVHGMAQRGGSVISFVRIGDQVNSPIVMPGTAEVSRRDIRGVHGVHQHLRHLATQKSRPQQALGTRGRLWFVHAGPSSCPLL